MLDRPAPEQALGEWLHALLACTTGYRGLSHLVTATLDEPASALYPACPDDVPYAALNCSCSLESIRSRGISTTGDAYLGPRRSLDAGGSFRPRHGTARRAGR